MCVVCIDVVFTVSLVRKILEGLRHDRRLTYGQLFSVVRTVNSDIRQSRKVPAAAMEVGVGRGRR